MIKIISGWSNQGGSTTAFINLTNALNEAGYETVFYGPHQWHLDKCKADRLQNFNVSYKDILIFHFIGSITTRPMAKRVIFSCHEQNIFPMSNINYKVFDKIHYVSKHQKNFHNVNHPSFVLPNIMDDLKSSDNKPHEKIGGIIGSVDRNKGVHLSIQKALEDGCAKVYIFGKITDPEYWNSLVQNLVDGETVVYKDFMDDKQAMYDMITDVYHSSLLESWGYIKGECKLTNVIFHGNSSTDGYWEMSKEQIINSWVKELFVK